MPTDSKMFLVSFRGMVMPMTQDEYHAFWEALTAAEEAPAGETETGEETDGEF